jgi:hypothetical protein
LGATAVKDYRAMQSARLTLARSLGEEAKLQAREASLRQELERPQLKEVYRYSRLINDVIERRGFSIQGLMEKVTRLLPEDVRLDALELDLEASGRVVRLAVSAEKEESLEKFLVNLEDSPDFADVSVISHGLPDSKSEDHDLATAACTVRYVAGGEKTP